MGSVYEDCLPGCEDKIYGDDLVNAGAIEAHFSGDSATESIAKEAETSAGRVGKTRVVAVCGFDHVICESAALDCRLSGICVEGDFIQTRNVDKDATIAETESISPTVALILKKKRDVVFVGILNLLKDF